MYEAFYGMRHRPFSPVPHPECFVPVPQMGDALRELKTCVERDQGMAVLTAPAGAGKTLLCRRLCRDLLDRYAIAFLGTSRFSSRRALLQGILYELGQPYIGLSEQESRLGLFDALRTEAGTPHPLLLVMDEAHLLPPRFLEELRTLADHDVGGERLIHVVLSGQLALEETLSEGPLSALNQRVGCHVCLESLTADESADYVRHRLAWAGLEGGDADTVFTPAALSLIVHAADGNPRRINQLADHALLIGFADEERPVALATVQSALVDLRELPLQWNEPLALSLSESEQGDAAPSAELETGSSWPGSPEPLGGSASSVFEWGPESTAGESAASGFSGPRFSFEPPPATERSPGGGASGEVDFGSRPGGDLAQGGAVEFRFDSDPPPADFPGHPDGADRDTAEGSAGRAAGEGIEAAESEVLSGSQPWSVREPGAPEDAGEGRMEAMSRAGFEEVMVDDRYAVLDRHNESGGTATAVDFAPVAAPRLALPWPEPLASGGERCIEEELRDLLIGMQSDMQSALGHASAMPLYDVVEPEDEPFGFESAPATLQFPPSSAMPTPSPPPPPLPAAAFESFLIDPEGGFPAADDIVYEEPVAEAFEGEAAEPIAEEPAPDRPLRRFAQLFSRLQRQRGRMETRMERDRE